MSRLASLWCSLALVAAVPTATRAQSHGHDHGASAAPHDGVPADVKAAATCQYCGMDREKFAHTRMVIDYEDGKTVGTCSLHCLAVELALSIDRSPKAIRVADLDTKQLVDAEAAVWVIGGSRPGVMTKRAKWAFASRPAADAFVQANGGQIATFEEAIKAAYEDMYSDTKAIRDRRKQMRAKMKETKKS